MQNLELLAPAGGMEQLLAAVRFGADAVYLATDRFGMRARAANFAMDELLAAVSAAHAAGVKVYVTCNVLMVGAADLEALPEYFRALAQAGVDAVILSDLGALRIAKRCAPGLAIHVSTQASVANAEAACLWHELGASRIVCAREMTLEDIAALRAGTPPELEIEAFVHGAMCMAVSGRCLISSYLTGRSGNKGHCTQPCRWSYTLEEEKRPGEHFPIEEDDRGSFIMNAKDLNMLAHLEALAQAGVTSFKIEGRNKKAFYVASVVNAYRQVLDGANSEAFAAELEAVSHRPYSTGFYLGQPEQETVEEGYTQTCLHVADIAACEPAVGMDGADCAGASESDREHEGANAGARAGASMWKVTAVCRNRFAEGDALEALVPRTPPVSVTVRNLTWLPDPTEAEPSPPEVPVPVANRSCNTYCFLASAPLEPGGFLRVRQFRRSARHAASS